MKELSLADTLFIKSNWKRMSDQELATNLGRSLEEIKSYLDPLREAAVLTEKEYNRKPTKPKQTNGKKSKKDPDHSA